MSRVIDGEGIRVVDIDLSDSLKSRPKVDSPLGEKANCVIKENTQNGFSHTAEEISRFFNCILTKGKGRVSDIVIEMGKSEGEWE